MPQPGRPSTPCCIETPDSGGRSRQERCARVVVIDRTRIVAPSPRESTFVCFWHAVPHRRGWSGFMSSVLLASLSLSCFFFVLSFPCPPCSCAVQRGVLHLEACICRPFLLVGGVVLCCGAARRRRQSSSMFRCCLYLSSSSIFVKIFSLHFPWVYIFCMHLLLCLASTYLVVVLRPS